MLDVGCGNGLNSYFFNKKLGTQTTLVDIEDIRDNDAGSFPFHKSSIENICFDEKSFDVVFLQFVIHHLPHEIDLKTVFRKLENIGKTVIIVEEIITKKTDEPKAREFDAIMNKKIHPDSNNMEIYRYYSDPELKELFAQSNLQVEEEKILFDGCPEDGFLQRKMYVLEQLDNQLTISEKRHRA